MLLVSSHAALFARSLCSAYLHILAQPWTALQACIWLACGLGTRAPPTASHSRHDGYALFRGVLAGEHGVAVMAARLVLGQIDDA